MKPPRLLEIKALIVIALPLIFAYLADVIMIITAKMVVGRLGSIDLAAAGISTDLSYQMCIILMGFFSVVGVLVSEARGALNRERIVPELVRGMILSGVLGLIITVVVLNLGHVLKALGQQPQVIELAGPYYTGFAFAMLPIVWFGVLRSFAAAMMKTGFVLAVAVVTVILNYFLMQGLVHGSFGFARMGIAGAGFAWAVSMWFKFLCLAVYTVFLIRQRKLPLHAGTIGGPRARTSGSHNSRSGLPPGRSGRWRAARHRWCSAARSYRRTGRSCRSARPSGGASRACSRAPT